MPRPQISTFFFFNDTATTEIYTLSLHDALPISGALARRRSAGKLAPDESERLMRLVNIFEKAVQLFEGKIRPAVKDRKSTRLNSSHLVISYAVFCLKKKNQALESLTRTLDHALS